MPFDLAPTASPQVAPEQRVLLRAIEIVERGHCKGRLVNFPDIKGGGNCGDFDEAARRVREGLPVEACLWGSIRVAAQLVDGDPYSKGSEEASCLLWAAGLSPHWNNQPERTAAEVASALRQAARYSALPRDKGVAS